MRVPCGGGVDPEDSRTGPEWAGELRYTIRTCDGLNENDSRRLTSEDLVPNGWGCLGRIKRCDDAGGGLSWRMALGLQEPPTIPRMLSASCVWIQTGALICCSGGLPCLCHTIIDSLSLEPKAQLTSWSCAWCLITAITKVLTQLLCSPNTETNEQALTPAALNDQSLGIYYL